MEKAGSSGEVHNFIPDYTVSDPTNWFLCYKRLEAADVKTSQET
jgi:hypothetical protein